MSDSSKQELAALKKRLQILEDEQAIARVKARYINYNDGGWSEQGPTHSFPEEVAELFTDDGIWDGRPVSGYAEGKDKIRELFTNFQVMPFIVHYVANPLILVDGDTAIGHWHALIAAKMPEQENNTGGQARWTLGLYKENFVRTSDGWKIKKLRFEPAANTNYDTGWGLQQWATD